MATLSVLDKDVKCLDIDNKIIDIFKQNNIKTLEDLWNLKRKDLKKYNLSDKDINQVIIKLQLLGLDLNNKIYNKL